MGDDSDHAAATKEIEEETDGARCEIKSLLLRSKKGEIEIVEKNTKITNEDPYSKYALVSRQSFDEQHKHTGTTLEINSPQLLSMLKDVVRYYPGDPLDFGMKFTIEDPYMMLVHHRKEMQEYREESDDLTTKMHIALLLEYLDAEAGPKGIEINDMIKAGSITFPLLWMIFKPGDLVYQHSNGHTRLFQLRRHGYGESSSGGKYFDISCSFVSFDGFKAGVATERLRIWDRQEFFGLFSATIESLTVFPLKFLDAGDRTKLETKLIERGERYLEIDGMCVKQYHGLFLYLKRPPWDYYNERADYDGTFLPETMSGRVVVDPRTFNEEARARKESIAAEESDDDEGDDKDRKTEMTGKVQDQLQTTTLDPRLCPPYVYGYSLEKKEWCKFFIDSMTEVGWKKDAMESLILPDPQKRLLKGLISGHEYPDRARDETTLKGKGLVVLLHGAPGSGKTLTAEMTAEHTRRPLLNISTGELGSYQHRIEIELKRLLTYASTFQAIVLIDEADVFLEARKSGPSDQLEQNAMVAVFLRQLEYFQGIIFLTSNRVSVFDQAIKSRIHLALQYTSPGKEVRRMLWEKHLANVPADEIDLSLAEALSAVEDTEMNGREISNAITTAKTLARSEGSKLKLEYLQTIVQVWNEFELSLLKLQKVDMLET
ncbi:hypothetical protein IFR05_010893 [Cadophora sp. M221]|nr:hypothetical protein IFR05_010893 [Cadophora sp. M221]